MSISVYPYKIEIANYGKLPKDLSVADLKKNHLSLPRNPDIAHVCFLTGWSEKIGRGTLKIVAECKAAGLREPKWSSQSGVTTLTFFRPEKGRNEVKQEELNERQRSLLKRLQPGKR